MVDNYKMKACAKFQRFIFNSVGILAALGFQC